MIYECHEECHEKNETKQEFFASMTFKSELIEIDGSKLHRFLSTLQFDTSNSNSSHFIVVGAKISCLVLLSSSLRADSKPHKFFKF